MAAEIAPMLWPAPLSDSALCFEACQILALDLLKVPKVHFLGTIEGPAGCGKTTMLRALAACEVCQEMLYTT
jgi:ABC-type Fe3+/spermidine/putrescine transport system ATPase subunit